MLLGTQEGNPPMLFYKQTNWYWLPWKSRKRAEAEKMCVPVKQRGTQMKKLEDIRLIFFQWDETVNKLAQTDRQNGRLRG